MKLQIAVVLSALLIALAPLALAQGTYSRFDDLAGSGTFGQLAMVLQ